MKKIIKAITLFLIIAIFSEVSYAAECLNSGEFNEKYMNNNVMWSGKEWITDTYPPKISQDGTDFTEVEGNEEIPNIMKFGQFGYKYVWTGSDYLVYKKNHGYLDANDIKYMYRLSEDFNTILNTYQIPNLINNLEFIDDKIFIATENVLPMYRVNGDPSSGILKAYRFLFEIYYSTDCVEWTKVENDIIKSFYGDGINMQKINDKLFINHMLYSDDKLIDIKYEAHEPCRVSKVGSYICEVVPDNEYKTENNTVLAFSNDGVYWAYLPIDIKTNVIQKVFELGDEIVIEDYRDYYVGDKEEVFSQLREKLPNNPVYVKFNDDILGFDEPPIIEDGSTLVPMRFLFEQMGADVEWDSETQTATATLDNTAVTFSIDNINAEVNKTPAQMDVPARLVNGKTMVPLRFLSENMGYDVDWDADSRTAIVNS